MGVEPTHAAKAEPERAPRRVVVLGATGSIGRSTADVLRRHPAAYQVEALAGGRDAEGLAAMGRSLNARFVAVADPASYAALKTALAGSGIEAAAGPEAVVEAATRESDIVIAAIAGTAGVRPTVAALSAGRTVALANKETLVCAGAPAMRLARAAGATVLPLDSEHNAIFQAMGAEPVSAIEKMILTASGGPFRLWEASRIAAATVQEALNHPNWAMGPKVTVDSASLMNKGLELVEAHHLFGIPADRLGVVVHPQSVVHGLVTFADGSVTAGMALPDMKVPIAHCLAYPERIESGARHLDLASTGTLTFEAPDLARFPALRLAMEMLAAGGAMPTVMNAANEVAVAAFIAGRITFGAMIGVVEKVCSQALATSNAAVPDSVEEALAVDHVSRERAAALLD